MKVHNYTPCLFGLLLWKEKGKKNKSVHKIWHKSVSFSFFFSFASQWFQVNHFVLTHPVIKSTSEVNRMREPVEAQHAMFIRHPKTTSSRWSILPAKLICLMCRCVLCQQYAILNNAASEDFWTCTTVSAVWLEVAAPHTSVCSLYCQHPSL